MNFEEFYKKFEQDLKREINSVSYYTSYIDKEDLFQEVALHLWNVWKENEFDKNTIFYILQSCKFYLKNYLRCIDDGLIKLSLDEELYGKEITLKEIIPDKSDQFSKLENKIFIDELLHNNSRLTAKEKQVLSILYKGFKSKERGYTIREIGSIIGISHVRVIKIKENLKRKIKNYLYT
ncbi:MAG: sigma-70 family RNA polymerase sigma factor [Candidatus Aenigmatarchaeota archaeon]